MEHNQNPNFAVHIPTTQEEFLQDREAFWTGFTKFVAGSAAAIILLLVVMGVFLV